MTWDEIWSAIVNFFSTQGLTILYAILVLVLGWVLVKIILKLMNKFLKRTKLAPITLGFINSILKILLYVVLIFAVLQVLGVPITGLATVLATAGVAISLALKDSLSNVAYGMILITTRPFTQGDYVKIDSMEGTVSSIEIMSTSIITTDNKKVVIPNSEVYSSPIVNYSALGQRRMEMLFDVAYDTDLEKAKEIMLKVCKSYGKIMLDPAPEVHLKFMNADNLSLFLTCWTKGPYWDVYFYLMENIFNEFKRNEISIDYKQIEVRMLNKDPLPLPYNKKPLPKRVEPKPEITEEFNLFDINSFADLQKKAKKNRIKNLEKKRQKIEKELKELKAKEPQPDKQMLLTTRSILLKKKRRLQKINKQTKFTIKVTKC